MSPTAPFYFQMIIILVFAYLLVMIKGYQFQCASIGILPILLDTEIICILFVYFCIYLFTHQFVRLLEPDNSWSFELDVKIDPNCLNQRKDLYYIFVIIFNVVSILLSMFSICICTCLSTTPHHFIIPINMAENESWYTCCWTPPTLVKIDTVCDNKPP